MDELDALYTKVEKAKPPSPPPVVDEEDEEEKRQQALSRRRLVAGSVTGAAMLAAGGLAGWWATRKRSRLFGGGRKVDWAPRLDLGLERHFEIDEKLIQYRRVGKFGSGFHRLRRLTVGPDDRVYVCGDQSMKIFDLDGRQLHEIKPKGLPHCVAIAGDGRIFMAAGDRIEIYGPDGAQQAQWTPQGSKVYFTALALAEDDLYVADARRREVVRYDRAGKEIDRFGKKDRARKNPGIVVPSPYFDLIPGPDGNIHLINPGRHRVEAYTPDGRYASSWGKPGAAIENFSGCCNPVYMTFLKNGDYVLSEKGLLRVKLHDAEGQFKGVVAGANAFVKKGEGAAASLRLNKGLDVAVDSKDRVLVSSPYEQTVQIFERKDAART